MNIDLLDTIDLCNGLKTFLAAIDHPTLAGQKLFEVVEFHDNKSLGEALQDLIIIKKRVCLVVPSGDSYQTQKEGRILRSDRTTSVDLLIADLAYTKGGHEAVFGGANNVGVIRMKEIVVKKLAESPQLDRLRWCALRPTEGAPLTISDSEKEKTAGREAYVLNYETPSGRIESEYTATWRAPV